MSYLICARRCSAFVSLVVPLGLFLFFLGGIAACVESAPPAPNSDPTYQALRNLTLSGESVSVNNLDLKRDAGTFHLRWGSLLCGSSRGQGNGRSVCGRWKFRSRPAGLRKKDVEAADQGERIQRELQPDGLRFTDATYDDLKKGGSAGGSNCDAGPLRDSQHTTRHKLKTNFESRILEDVLSPEPGGLFVE